MLFAASILIVSSLVFQKLFDAGFVSWDDALVLLKNKDVHAFNIEAFFTKQYVGNYAPVTMTSFALDWALFQGSAFYQHSVNLLLHYANGLLIILLLKRLFPFSAWRPYLVGLIFLFHPLQVETVGWISAKNNPLYTLFFLVGLWAYLEFQVRKSRRYYGLCLAFFILSILSKPSAIVFPFCLLLLDGLPAGKFELKSLCNKIPFFLLSLILGLVTLSSRAEAEFLDVVNDHSLPERIGLAGYAISKYVLAFLLPSRLSVIYPYPANIGLAVAIGYAVFAILIFISILLYKKRLFPILFGLLFFLVNLVLVLQVVPIGEALVADRYMYLPIVGLSICLLYSIKIPKRIAIPIGLLWVAALSISSYHRSAIWNNSITLFEDILDKHPSSVQALSSLGAEYMLLRDYNKALSFLNKAIQINPAFHPAYYNRGLVHAQTGRMPEAVRDFSTAIHLSGNTKALLARGNAYYEMNMLDKAQQDGAAVLAEDSDNPAALFLLARCLDEQNNLQKALEYYNAAIEQETDDPRFFLRRAVLFGKLKQFNASMHDLEIAVRLAPDNGEAYYWMAIAKVSQRQNPCPELKKAASLNFQPAIEAAKGCQ